MDTDTYKTLSQPSEEILYKEKNSKFYAYAFPLDADSQVKPIIDNLRKLHQGAGHFCYAWQIGVDPLTYRANDDGEPSNTAGMPIYGQIQSYGITNVLVLVVRYFGGTKLGVGGLISAYRTAAQMAIENSAIVEQTLQVPMTVVFEYKNLNRVMRIIKEKNIDIVAQKMELDCRISISVRQKDAQMIRQLFESSFGILVENTD